MTTAHFAPIPNAIRVPYGLLRASSTNPRKRFDEAYIAELASSIKAHDVTTPLLVRPTGEPDGAPQFEIVFGECRQRACGVLEREAPGSITMPVIVRELSDFEAAELQIVENIQRNDLHPLEEAEHFERMLADPNRPTGYGVAELAAHIGKDEGYVNRRLKLLALAEPARQAFMAGQLTARTALLVARVPSAHAQGEIVRHITTWGGEPMGAKAAAKFIQERYMLRLATAPFDASDATLVPDAGACGACPKRTGANPQLFDDISDADTCTDPACFALKKQALRDRNVQAERDAGHQVLTGDEARKVCTAEGRALKPELLALEQKVPFYLGEATLTVQEVVTKAELPAQAVTVVAHPDRDTLLRAVDIEVLEGALKRLKLSRKQLELKAKRAERTATTAQSAQLPAGAPAPAPAGGKADFTDAGGNTDEALLAELMAFEVPASVAGRYQGQTLEQFITWMRRRTEAVLVAHAAVRSMQDEGGYGMPAGPELAKMVIVSSLYGDFYVKFAALARLVGVEDAPPERDLQAKVAWVWELEEEPAYQLAMAVLAVQESTGKDGFERFAPSVATLVDVDTRPLAKRAEAYVNERVKLGALTNGLPATKKKRETKAAKGETKKPAAAKKTADRATAKSGKPLPRYRDARTGETWSGRGLQPKWLKLALASGKKLSDFDIAATPPKITAKEAMLSGVAAWPFPTGPKP